MSLSNLLVTNPNSIYCQNLTVENELIVNNELIVTGQPVATMISEPENVNYYFNNTLVNSVVCTFTSLKYSNTDNGLCFIQVDYIPPYTAPAGGQFYLDISSFTNYLIANVPTIVQLIVINNNNNVGPGCVYTDYTDQRIYISGGPDINTDFGIGPNNGVPNGFIFTYPLKPQV